MDCQEHQEMTREQQAKPTWLQIFTGGKATTTMQKQDNNKSTTDSKETTREQQEGKRKAGRIDLYAAFLLQCLLPHTLFLQSTDELHTRLFNNQLSGWQKYFYSPWGWSPCSDEHPSPSHDALHPEKWKIINISKPPSIINFSFVIHLISVIHHPLIDCCSWSPGLEATLQALWSDHWC